MFFVMRPIAAARGRGGRGLPVVRQALPLALVGSILAACIGVAACLLAKDLRDNTIRNTEQDLRGLTMLEAEQADRMLMAVELVGDDLSDRLLAEGAQSGASFAARAGSSVLRRRLDASLSSLPQVVAIGITDGQGQLLGASRAWPATDADLSARPFFRRLGETVAARTIVAEPIAGNGGPTMMLYVSRRVLDANGGTLGFVLSAIDMRYFERLYASVAPSEADVISIVSAERMMLARHPSPPGAIGRVVPPVPGLRRSPGDPEGSGVARMVTPIDGRDRFISIRPLEHYPLIVGASRTVGAALFVWHRQTVALGIVVVMLIVAFSLFCGSNARRLRDRVTLAGAEAARTAAEVQAQIDHRLARHDALTGLGNRLLLEETVQRLPASDGGRRRLALLLLDLDGFKRVNDIHGHPHGDALLRLVADRLGRLLIDGELLTRLGGDEFAILSGIGAPISADRRIERAIALADRIVAALQVPFAMSGDAITIGTSIGILDVDDADRGLELLLRDADIALYRAKAAGRGTWSLFDPRQARPCDAGVKQQPVRVDCAA